MKSPDRLDAGQLQSLCAVSLLAPALRFCPTAAALAAGRAAWLAMLLALPPLLLYGAFLWRFLSLRREGEGLDGPLSRAAGEKAAPWLLCLTALWLLFYAGFSLRAGAERFASAASLEIRKQITLILSTPCTPGQHHSQHKSQ